MKTRWIDSRDADDYFEELAERAADPADLDIETATRLLDEHVDFVDADGQVVVPPDDDDIPF